MFPWVLNIEEEDRFHAGVELTTRTSLGPCCINFPDRDHPPAKSNSGECGHFRVSFHLRLYLTSPWVTRHRNRTNGTGISFEHYDIVAFAPTLPRDGKWVSQIVGDQRNFRESERGSLIDKRNCDRGKFLGRILILN